MRNSQSPVPIVVRDLPPTSVLFSVKSHFKILSAIYKISPVSPLLYILFCLYLGLNGVRITVLRCPQSPLEDHNFLGVKVDAYFFGWEENKRKACECLMSDSKVRAQCHSIHSFQSPIHAGRLEMFVESLLFARPRVLV